MKLTKTKLDAGSLPVEETLFHVANGYLGVRGSFEEGAPKGVSSVRGCYINGFYDTVRIDYHEKLFGFPETAQRLVNLPDVQTMRLFLDGEQFSTLNGKLLDYERVLDTDEGVAHRRMLWKSTDGKTAEIEITRMASFARPELFLTVYAVESVDFDGEIELVSGIDCDVSNFTDPSDPRVASGGERHIFFDGAAVNEDGTALVRCHTGASNLSLAVCQKHKTFADTPIPDSPPTPSAPVGARIARPPSTRVTESGTETRLTARLHAGGSFRVEKFTLLSDSRRQADPAAHALSAAEESAAAGAAELFREQRAFLDKFWQASRTEIRGCPEINDALDFALFELLQSAGRDAHAGLAAKGISGEGYEGHFFWDTEVYIFPFFLFTRPEIARSLLDFRYGTLAAACEHAKTLGHKRGALYPWRTITGSECSSYFPAGSAQYHITGDVAHAFMQYYRATGELTYMADKGAEVLIETARLWLDVGNYDADGRFHIHGVTGPDEYTCLVHDNYYTNSCAQYNLRAAAEIYGLLKAAGLSATVKRKTGFDERELAEFLRAAEAMVLPYDETRGIHMQDASFLDKPVWDIAATPKENFPLLLHYHPMHLYRHQVCKQADTVLAHFLFGDDVPEDVQRRSFEYYEKLTTHDSSLSSCVFGIMASRLGLDARAYDYFPDSVRIDLDNAHGNTKDGLHTASLGGAWLSLVCGFAGLRLREDGLHFRFSLPAQWEGYSFRVRYRGSLLHVNVSRGGAEIALEAGAPVTVFVDSKPRRVGGE